MNARARRELRFIRGLIDLSPGECWDWKGPLDYKGYGKFNFGERHTGAHRVAYELWVGPIPEGMTIDHLCRNPACVNPKHLEVVTSAENTLRGFGVTAINARKTHCPQGHEYTPENTMLWGPNRRWRVCRTCDREKQRLRWRKRKTEKAEAS